MAENKAQFTIPDIDSEADVDTLRSELDDETAILGVNVDPNGGEAEIRYDVDLVSEEQVEEMVRDAGYEAQ
jgi:copper chaperone CopZ